MSSLPRISKKEAIAIMEAAGMRGNTAALFEGQVSSADYWRVIQFMGVSADVVNRVLNSGVAKSVKKKKSKSKKK